MLRLGQIHTGEIAFGEHDPFGAQPTEVVVAEIVTYELLVDPDVVECTHTQLGAELRLLNAYSVIAMSASRVEFRSRASTLTMGTWPDSDSALRTS